MPSRLTEDIRIKWLELPSLPYLAAFDQCAVESACNNGPVILIASNRLHAREILKRVQNEVYLLPLSVLDLSTEDSRAELGPEIDWTRVHVLGPGEIPQPMELAIWAGPRLSEIEVVQPTLLSNLGARGRLLVLTNGRFRALLPERAQESQPANHDLAGTALTVRLLKRNGFRLLAVYGFQGPSSLVWGFLGRLVMTAGREDLLDRCLAAMRRTLCTQGPGAYLAPVALLVAERG